MKETDYREAYERECQKCADLTGRLADLADRYANLEMENEDLKWRLDRIKGNPLWKLSRPLRAVARFCLRQFDRLRNCGGIRGVFQKLAYKRRERKPGSSSAQQAFPPPPRLRPSGRLCSPG